MGMFATETGGTGSEGWGSAWGGVGGDETGTFATDSVQ